MAAFANIDQGSPSYDPRAESGPPESFHPAREDILSITNDNIFPKNCCGRMWHTPKLSQYVRCAALKLLCNSLCGPLTRQFGDPWCRPRTSNTFTHGHCVVSPGLSIGMSFLWEPHGKDPMGWDSTHLYFPWDSSHVIATSLRQS